jgi:S1-C subfamily serine protease
VALARHAGHNRGSTKPTVTQAPPPSPSTSATSASFATLYTSDRTGVVKILTTTCDEAGEGTGFVIGRRLIATVAHVVSGEVTMTIKAGSSTYSGRVIGIDNGSDVALIRTSEPIAGHVFHFASVTPSVGDQLAVLGYPLDGPLTFTSGSVSGLNRREDIEGIVRTGLLQTDAAVNPGNSGGPLLDAQGDVAGLVDAKVINAEGLGYAVTARTAEPLLDSWRSSPQPTTRQDCGSSLTPPATNNGDPFQTVTAYFNAINAKDWTSVWALGGRNLGTSFSAMVAGYANTAHDDAFIYRLSGRTVEVALLATEDSGIAQVYLGEYDVDSGAISSGHQTLQSTDSGTGYDPVAGTWEGHGRYLVLSSGGTGIIAYRSYTWCSDDPSTGCDGISGDDIVDGGLTTFRLSSSNGDQWRGRYAFSTTGVAGSVLLERRPNDTLQIPSFTSVPFCGPRSPEGICGA